MIESLSIFLNLFVYLILCLFPIQINLVKQNNSLFYSKNLFDILTLNLIINLTIIFLISFTNSNFTTFFYFYILISILYNFSAFLRYKNYFYFLKNKNFVLFIIINIVIFFNLAQNPTLAWDGLENWYFKAQSFFYNLNFFDLKNNIGNNNYYPHFGSFLWGFFWKNSIVQYEYFGRLIGVFVYLLTIFSIFELIEKKNFIKLICLSLVILICYDDFLFRGYQEVFLFSSLILVSKYFYLYFLNKKFEDLCICFLIVNLIPWIKHEGYLFSIILTFSFLLMTNRFFRKIEIIIFVLLSWILIVLKNYIFYLYLDLNFVHGGGYKFIFSFTYLYEFLIIFSKGLIVAFFKYKIWVFIILSAIFIYKYKFLKSNQKLFFKFLYINFLLFFFMIFAIYYNLYLNSSMDFNWWIDNSLDRLLYSISGLFLIFVILNLNNLKDYSLK